MLDKQPLELSGDFQYALDLIEKTDKSLFVTGRAGTGKSTLLQLFRKTTRKKTVVLAPTGVAALNVSGQTIHSFFGFPPHPIPNSEIRKRRNRKLYKKLDVLVIDEISMVRADLLDQIDYFLRINRDNVLQPFGGVQVVFFGDLFQLPPVVSSQAEKHLFDSYYESPYFFSAKVFAEFSMEMLELRKVYRQDARHFVRLLDAIRMNTVDRYDLMDLNERHFPDFATEDFHITLSARNDKVNLINRLELESIDLPEKTFLAEITGNFNPRLYPTEAALKLKLSAQVMFVKNDPERQFVNGTIGKIVKLEDDQITVLVEERNRPAQYIKVQPLTWEILKYKTDTAQPDKIETETVGTFTQYPLKLAWAITIHKSQGKTFDKVIIDLGKGAFEHGQTYVALSRCRTLEGIILKKPIRPQDVITDPKIVEFYQQNF